MRHRRRRRKFVVGLAIVLVAVLAWPDRLPPDRDTRRTEVAGAVFERGDGFTGPLFELPDFPPTTSTVAAAAPPGDVAIAPPPEHFEEPPAPPAPPPRPLRRGHFDGVQPQSGTWAVMIGVNDYPGSRYDLGSAVADAEDVNRALGMLGVPGNNRLIIRDRQASADTIRMAVDWLVAHAGPDAVAVFFYAGHVRRLGGGTEAVVAADGQLIHDAELGARLAGLQARRAWIALASCYSGGFTEVLKDGRILTAAAPAHSLAYENHQFGRSYLVEYMVRRAFVENRASQNVQVAFKWAHDELSRDYPNRVPVQYDYAGSPLDLRQPGAASVPPSSPPPSGSSGTTSDGSTSDDSGGSTTDGAPERDDNCSRWTLGVVRCDDD